MLSSGGATRSTWAQCVPLPNEDLDDWFGRLQTLNDQLALVGRAKTEGEICIHIYTKLRFIPGLTSWAQMNLNQRRVAPLLILQQEASAAHSDWQRTPRGSPPEVAMWQQEVDSLKSQISKIKKSNAALKLVLIT